MGDVPWSGVVTVVAIALAGFATFRGEWIKSTMNMLHMRNDELRDDNDYLAGQVDSLKGQLQEEHTDCERRLNEEVGKWNQEVGQLKEQIGMIQGGVMSDLKDAVVTAISEGVKTVLDDLGVSPSTPTTLRRLPNTSEGD